MQTPIAFHSSCRGIAHSVARQAHRPVLRYSTQCRAAAKLDPKILLEVAHNAAQAGAKVIQDTVDQPKQLTFKSNIDIVTETDKASEAACVAAIRQAFPEHAILGEEGGVSGDVSSDYLWCIDPLDGTVNFAHSYRGFCVSVGVLRHSLPVAGCVIEFTGGPGNWDTRVYAARRNMGATCDGKPISVSNVRSLNQALVATEVTYYPELWQANTQLLQHFAQNAAGIRCCGAAAVNLCHLASGVVDTYYQYMLKPWDVAAGVLIAEEAGGRVSTADGLAYSVFDRSLLATNDALYPEMLAQTEPLTSKVLERKMIDLGPWCIPEGYKLRAGAQLG